MLAHARAVLGGIAMCPVTLTGDVLKSRVTFFPYGTCLGGGEVERPGSSGGLVQALIRSDRRGERTRACCYNGVRERMVVALMPFSEPGLSDEGMARLVDIADGALVSGDENGMLHPFTGDNVSVPEGVGQRAPGTVYTGRTQQGNYFAGRAQGDSQETQKLKKEAIQHFRGSLRRRQGG